MVKFNEKYETIKDISSADIKGKKILMRADYNVPISDGEIKDDRKIVSSVETIKEILTKKPARLIITSHLGRPEGVTPTLSLKPVAERLSKLIKVPVILITLEDIEKNPKNYKHGIYMLENIRFYPEEEKNDPEFAKRLAALGQIYVGDAFGTMHREHASTYGAAHLLPSYIGLLVKKEITHLNLTKAKHPFVVVIGGAKVSTKLSVIKSLAESADKIIIGSGMALTVYSAEGFFVGSSFVEVSALSKAKKIFDMENVVFPIDFKVSLNNDDSKVITENRKVSEIKKGEIGGDIGDESLKLFEKYLKKAKTIFWNGPLGIYEVDKFAVGTNNLAQYISDLKAEKIIGGGDIAAAIDKIGISNKFDFISTGGGASLELLSKGKLPALEAILRSQKKFKI